MTLRQKLLYMDLTFTYFAVLQMIVNGKYEEDSISLQGRFSVSNTVPRSVRKCKG